MAAKKKYKYKNGDKVKVVGCSHGTGVAIGTVATIQGPINGGYYRLQEYPNWNFPTCDLELVPCTFTKDSVEQEVTALQAQIDVLNGKLAYLEETGLDTGCDKEFKVYQTLSLVENGELTKQQKAKAIAALLEQEA